MVIPALLTTVLALLIVNAVIVLATLKRVSQLRTNDSNQIVRDELRQGREESGKAARDLREEVGQALKSTSDTTVKTVGELAHSQEGRLVAVATEINRLTDSNSHQLETVRSAVESQLTTIRDSNEQKFNGLRQEVLATLGQMSDDTHQAGASTREELSRTLKATADSLVRTVGELGQAQKAGLDGFASEIKSLSANNEGRLDTVRNTLETQLTGIRQGNEATFEQLRTAVEQRLTATIEDSRNSAKQLREEVASGLKNASDTLLQGVGEMGTLLKANLQALSDQVKILVDTSNSGLSAVRAAVDQQLRDMREHNDRGLEEIRKTVNEQLQGTLEKRLGDSFRLVSERLEAVQNGLGEMKNLATGVGDLKKVLTNVKVRGTWAEVQLGAILEQMLTPQQYSANVRTNAGSNAFVEFAIRLPGRDGDPADAVWLPIDSKFPTEDYQRLIDASEAGNSELLQSAAAALARTVKCCADTIRDKYLDPPHTTDFAILFLPTEGLYAEVVRQPALVEQLQQSSRVMVAGPTTLAAILCSLRMGFRTVAIQQRASDVWNILAAVKTEFGKFGGILDKVKKQLDTAASTIDQTRVRTRAMERKLRDVEGLTGNAVAQVLAISDGQNHEELIEEVVSA